MQLKNNLEKVEKLVSENHMLLRLQKIRLYWLYFENYTKRFHLKEGLFITKAFNHYTIDTFSLEYSRLHVKWSFNS